MAASSVIIANEGGGMDGRTDGRTETQWCFNVEPASQTPTQHCNTAGLQSRINLCVTMLSARNSPALDYQDGGRSRHELIVCFWCRHVNARVRMCARVTTFLSLVPPGPFMLIIPRWKIPCALNRKKSQRFHTLPGIHINSCACCRWHVRLVVVLSDTQTFQGESLSYQCSGDKPKRG